MNACGANASPGAPSCPFAPVAVVRFELPPGHPYGASDDGPTAMSTSSCAVHLDALLATVDDLGATPEVERVHPDGMRLQ